MKPCDISKIRAIPGKDLQKTVIRDNYIMFSVILYSIVINMFGFGFVPSSRSYGYLLGFYYIFYVIDFIGLVASIFLRTKIYAKYPFLCPRKKLVFDTSAYIALSILATLNAVFFVKYFYIADGNTVVRWGYDYDMKYFVLIFLPLLIGFEVYINATTKRYPRKIYMERINAEKLKKSVSDTERRNGCPEND